MNSIRVLVFATDFMENAPTESILFNEYLNFSKIVSIIVLARNFSNKTYENLRTIQVPAVYKPLWTFRNVLAFTTSMIKTRNEFDIIYTRMIGPHILIPAIIAKLLFRKKFVLFIPGAHQLSKSKENRNLRLIMRIATSIADKIGANSPSYFNEFEYHMGKKIDRKKKFIINQNVDINRFKPKNQDIDENLILSIGRITPIKGFETLIKAVPYIVNEFPDVQIKIIGLIEDQVYYNKLKDLSKDTGYEKNIEFLGLIAHTKLVDWFNSCKIFILTSKSEGQANVILEAMACSKPVIVTSVGGSPDLIEDGINGLLVRVDKPKELAQKIVLLLRNREYGKKIGRVARKTIEEKFSGDIFINKFKEIFEEVSNI